MEGALYTGFYSICIIGPFVISIHDAQNHHPPRMWRICLISLPGCGEICLPRPRMLRIMFIFFACGGLRIDHFSIPKNH